MSRSGTPKPTADARINAVLSPYAWADLRVSFSIPDAAGDYGRGYADQAASRFSAVTAAQASSLRAILEGKGGLSVEGFTNLSVTEAARGSGAGEIRFGNSAKIGTAYGYMPGDHYLAGDVWFGTSGRAPRPGNYDNLTLRHETGHALGLKHPHERDGAFGALDPAWDSMEYTVMTYRPWAGAKPGSMRAEAWGYAQSYMMLDIAAMQRMYGADFRTNSGDTVYSWTPRSGATFIDGKAAVAPGANRIFLTIWDGGGTDTYDLSAYATNLRIDLAPGAHSLFSKAQTAYLGGGPNGGNARGNVFNALQFEGDSRSLIENAIGGAGADSIRGNAASNRLVGNGGRDTLLGADGDDFLFGGGGADFIYGGRGRDTLRGGADRDLLVGGAGRDVLIGGAGGDIFRFAAAAESGPVNRDTLRAGDGGRAFDGPGKAAGDLIDLKAIDANSTRAGDQAFVFGASQGKGRLWAVDVGTNTHIYGNTDKDRAPEFELIIEDGATRASAYTAHDFIL